MIITSAFKQCKFIFCKLCSIFKQSFPSHKLHSSSLSICHTLLYSIILLLLLFIFVFATIDCKIAHGLDSALCIYFQRFVGYSKCPFIELYLMSNWAVVCRDVLRITRQWLLCRMPLKFSYLESIPLNNSENIQYQFFYANNSR